MRACIEDPGGLDIDADGRIVDVGFAGGIVFRNDAVEIGTSVEGIASLGPGVIDAGGDADGGGEFECGDACADAEKCDEDGDDEEVILNECRKSARDESELGEGLRQFWRPLTVCKVG